MFFYSGVLRSKLLMADNELNQFFQRNINPYYSVGNIFPAYLGKEMNFKTVAPRIN